MTSSHAQARVAQRPRILRSVSLLVLFAVLSSGCVFLNQVTLTSAQTEVDNINVLFDDVSSDGRYVVFSTYEAFELSDTNSTLDVYLRDVMAGTVERVSVTNTGGLSNGFSKEAAVSADGRYIAFESSATNLTPAGANSSGFQIYLRDRIAGTTTQVTSGNGWSQNADISANGTVVVFNSFANDLVDGDSNNIDDVFHWQRSTGVTTRLSVNNNGEQGNYGSYRPSTSSTGLLTAYHSLASNLVNSDTNGASDVFVSNPAGVTFRVSTTANGTQLNGASYNARISSSGVKIAFDSNAPDVVPDDTNQTTDIFLKTLTGPVEMVSLLDDGTQFSADFNNQRLVGMSGDTNRIAFTSYVCAGACVNTLYVRNLTVETTTDYETGNNSISTQSVISNDGRYIVFLTDQQLTGDDTDSSNDIYIQTYPEPAPTTVAPSLLPRGQTTSVTVNGRGYEDVTEVFVSLFNLTTDDLYVSNIAVIDDATITADITVLSTADLGPKNLFITSPDGGPGQFSGALGICPACVTVTS